jgi:hypothetical protein
MRHSESSSLWKRNRNLPFSRLLGEFLTLALRRYALVAQRALRGIPSAATALVCALLQRRWSAAHVVAEREAEFLPLS